MKALLCYAVGGLHLTSFGEEWRRCECRQTAVRWEDPDRGTVVVAAMQPEYVRIMGLSNAYLLPALGPEAGGFEAMRLRHTRATEAPGYVFDAAKAACWAVIFRVGSTGDVRWASAEETKQAFA